MGTSAGPDIVENGLVLHLDAANKRSYPSSGTTWTDLSGQGNSGSLINSPTFNTGNLGNLVFTTQTQYAEFADIPMRINSPNFSIEAVFYFDNTDTLAVFQNKRNPNSPYKQFGMFMSDSSIINGVPGKHLCFLLIPDNSPSVFSMMRSLSYDLSLGGGARIVHAVGVNDSTSARLYINGQLVASNATAQPSATYNISGYNSYCRGPTTLYLSKLYNITLTQQQIIQNFNAIRGRYGI
jgi:hypothetical protein